MRDREIWAFVVGIVLAVVGAIGSVFAFETLAPGLLLIYVRRDRD